MRSSECGIDKSASALQWRLDIIPLLRQNEVPTRVEVATRMNSIKTPLVSAAVAVILAVVPSAALGGTEEIQQLIDTRACIGCDLKDASLIGVDLHGVDLRSADLSGALLTEANLSAANLTDANLSGASLLNANLMGADLTGAILRSVDLSGANLDDVTISLISLRQAVICFTWLPNGQMYLLQQNCP